jgi:predicted DNA-binding ribbon-helix-helix protein
MTSSIIGQSVAVDEHKTGAVFEGELWIGLDTIVHARHMTMSELVFAIRSAAKATSPQPASPYSPPVAQWWPRNALRPQQ